MKILYKIQFSVILHLQKTFVQNVLMCIFPASLSPLVIFHLFQEHFFFCLQIIRTLYIIMKYPYGNKVSQRANTRAGGRARKYTGYMHNIFLLRSRCCMPQVCFPIGKPRSNISLLLLIPRYYVPVYRCYASVSWDFTMTGGCPVVLCRGARNYNSYKWRTVQKKNNALPSFMLPEKIET